MQTKVIMLVFAMCLFIIGGCQSNSKIETVGTDPIILLHNLDGGMDMAVEGTLEYDSSTKCFFIYNNPEYSVSENERMIPIWPKGTTIHSENNLHGVQVPEYGMVMDGDEISTGGGGGIERSELTDLDYPSECLDDGLIIYITPG